MDPRGDKKQVTIGYQIVICFWTLKTSCGRDRHAQHEAKVAPGRFNMGPRGDKKQRTIGHRIVTCFWTLKMSRERDRNSPKGCNNNPFGHLLGCPFWGEGSFGGAYSPFWKNSSSHRRSASRHPPDHAGTRQGQPGNQSRVHRNPLKDNLIEARPGQVTHTLSLFLSLSPSLSLLIRNRVACWWNNSQR